MKLNLIIQTLLALALTATTFSCIYYFLRYTNKLVLSYYHQPLTPLPKTDLLNLYNNLNLNNQSLNQSISELNEEIDGIKAQEEDLIKQIKHSKETGPTLNKNIEDLQSQLTAKHEEKDIKLQELKDLEQQYSDNSKKIADLEEQIKTSEVQLTSANSQIDAKEEAHLKANEVLNIFNAEVEDTTKELSLTQSKIEDLKTHEETIKQQYFGQGRKVWNLFQRLKEAENKLRYLEQEAAELIPNIAKLDKTISDSISEQEEAKAYLELSTTNLNNKYQEWFSYSQTLEKLEEDLKKEIDKLISFVDDFHSKSNQQTGKIYIQKGNLITFKDDDSIPEDALDFNQHIAALYKDYEELSDQDEQYKDEIQTAIFAKINGESYLNLMNYQVDFHTNNQTKFKNWLQEVQDKSDTLKDSISTLREEHSSSTTLFDDLLDVYEASKKDTQEAIDTLNIQKENHQKLLEANAHIFQNAQTAEQEYQSIKQQIDDLTKSIEDAQKTLPLLINSNIENQEQIDTLRAEIENLHKEIKNLEDLISSANKEIIGTSANIEALNESLTNIKTTLKNKQDRLDQLEQDLKINAQDLSRVSDELDINPTP